MAPTILSTIRSMSATRAVRVLCGFVLVMCSVTWLAQAATAASGQAATLGALAAQAAQAELEADGGPCELEDDCEASPIFILDETHDIKLFLLKDFTHSFPRNSVHMPRKDQLADIRRSPSETFRPPDSAIGHREHALAA